MNNVFESIGFHSAGSRHWIRDGWFVEPRDTLLHSGGDNPWRTEWIAAQAGTSTSPARTCCNVARAVEAFKARVDTADMTRRARAAEERAFLESIGAASVFRECPDVESSHVRTPSHPHRDGR